MEALKQLGSRVVTGTLEHKKNNNKKSNKQAQRSLERGTSGLRPRFI
jgi:hypothetical protein